MIKHPPKHRPHPKAQPASCIECKKTDDARRKSEELLRTVLNNAPITIFAIDTKGVFTLSDGKSLEQVNLKPGDNVGVSALDLFATLPVIQPNGKTITGREVISRVLTGETLTGITQLRNVYFDNQFVPYYGANGRVNGVIGVATIVTKRLQAEKALQESETRYRTLFQTSADGILIADIETKKFKYANTSICKMFGYTEEQLRMMRVKDIHPKNALPTVIAEFNAQALGKKKLAENIPCLRKDGTIFYADINSVSLSIDNKICNVGFFRDITEHRKMKEALTESEKRLKDITFSMADWIWEVDENGVYTYSSHKGFEFFGPAREDIIGKTPFDFMPPDEAKRVAAIFSEIAANKAPIHDLENWNIKKNGERICLLTNGVPILDEKGNLKGYRGVDKDITERKKLESQLLHAQKMEAIGRLVGSIAHDFNNALTVIDGYSTLMLEGLKPDDPMREGIATIKKASEHSATLTRQLLAFSRKQVLQKTRLNVNILINNMEKLLTRVIGKDIGVNFVLAPALKFVNADIGQVEQILMNLSVNARDAMPKGGTLTIKTENIFVNLAYCQTNPEARTGNFVRLSIRDTGTGMSDDVKKHLFEPFFTTKGLGKGTGLGLSVVYGIVKQHDGWSDVYSEPGKGTTFNIYLPALGAAVKAKANPGKKVKRHQYEV
ncbi:MAG: PAS domain S-box protein [Planctomycetes bacterium]|nr:PAS domain S-box protein [Planctomycetota bacterium]